MLRTSRRPRTSRQRDGEQFPLTGKKSEALEAAVVIKASQRERKLSQVTRTASGSRRVTDCVLNRQGNLRTRSLAVRRLLTKTATSHAALIFTTMKYGKAPVLPCEV